MEAEKRFNNEENKPRDFVTLLNRGMDFKDGVWIVKLTEYELKYYVEELQSLRDQLADKEQENAELIKANKLLTKKCAEYMMRLAGNPEI